MSGFCGWIGLAEAGSEQEQTLATMAAGLIGQAGEFNNRHLSGETGLATARATSIATEADVLVAIEGRPWWRNTDGAEVAARDGIASALLAAYSREGRNALRHLAGGWSTVLIDNRKRYALLAIDRVGIQPLCFAPLPGAGVVFGSTADSVGAHPAVDTIVDQQSIYDLLYFTRISAPNTIYAGIKKLEPGQALEITDGTPTIWPYWRMTYVKRAHNDADALAEELRDIVRRAVARSIEGTDPETVGAYLSGGLDSSTVTGVLSELSPRRVKAFTVGFDEPGYDEMEFAASAAQHFDVEHHSCYVTPADIIDFLPRMAAIYDEPFANGSAVPAYYCARQAQASGIRVMLAGDGGDELFAGNERYVTQRIFERYFDIPAWIRSLLIEPLVRLIPDGATGVLRKSKGYVRRASIRLPDRLESFNHFGDVPATAIFVADIARQIDTDGPLATMRRHYHAPENASTLDRMMYLDMRTTISDDDLRKVNRTAEENGIEVRYPLLDDEIVDFATRLPGRLLLKRGELRWFFKNAMREFLPRSTLTKTKHGFGLPFDQWIRTDKNLREYVDGKLAKLGERDLFLPEFLAGTISEHRRGENHSFGQLVWALLLLELWFESRIENFRVKGVPDGSIRPDLSALQGMR